MTVDHDGKKKNQTPLYAHDPEHLDGGAVTMPRERGAIRLTQENYRVNSIWYDRERERGAQCRACSLILFSIHCAQRLEAPEGSPARSLDALPRTLR